MAIFLLLFALDVCANHEIHRFRFSFKKGRLKERSDQKISVLKDIDRKLGVPRALTKKRTPKTCLSLYSSSFIAYLVHVI